MKTAIMGLLGSKKALVAGLAVVAATVLVVTGKLDIESWKDMAEKVVMAFLVAQGVADHGKGAK